MLRSLAAAALAIAALTACGNMNLGRLKGATATAAGEKKKDCAACEKMCSVAGDSEKNPNAVADCKADCKKTCQ